jgi:hypothetical protein
LSSPAPRKLAEPLFPARHKRVRPHFGHGIDAISIRLTLDRAFDGANIRLGQDEVSRRDVP